MSNILQFPHQQKNSPDEIIVILTEELMTKPRNKETKKQIDKWFQLSQIAGACCQEAGLSVPDFYEKVCKVISDQVASEMLDRLKLPKSKALTLAQIDKQTSKRYLRLAKAVFRRLKIIGKIYKTEIGQGIK